jgi:outer membrane receptor protein involved in Fe transport
MKRHRRTLICCTLVAAVSTGTAAADDPAPPPGGTPRTTTSEPPPAGVTSDAPVADAAPPPSGAPPSDPPPPPAAPAVEPGTVKGQIVDGDTQVGLAAATIRVLGGPDGERTVVAELDGTYELSLAPGSYTIVVSTAEYVEQRRTIAVTAAQAVALDVVLAPVPRTGKAETIEVYGAIDTRKDTAVLAERRAAATVSDAISAQQIARSPDSNASDAAKRMVAATIQDNRYVVIRGLGGRYSTTLLNGVPLPSPDPDVPAAPLDLFPAALITNLTVHKTFAPDMPGNFAGGALSIETRSYPTSFLFKAKVGVGSNSASSFRTLNGQSGGSLDMLGYDDGGRALPGAIPGDKLAGDSQLTVDQRNAQIAGFQNNWSIRRGMVGPNLNLGATIGDTVRQADHRIGYFASATFSHGYSARRTHIARVGDSDGSGGTAPSVLQLDDEQGIEHANLGALAGVGWTRAPGHKLDLFTLYAHTADSTASVITGTDNSTAIVDRTRLQFLERELMFTQLVGEDRLAEHAILTWQANVARVAQHEPDTRDLQRTQTPDGRLAISSSAGSSERLFGELADNTFGAAAALRMPFDAVRLEAGASVQRSARDYQARRFHFNLTGDAVFLTPDEAFAPEHAGDRMSMYEATLPSDGYRATRTIAGAYAMADVQPTAKLRLVGGARFERASLDVGLDSQIDQMLPPTPATTRDDADLLPSLNAVYALTPSLQLRAAYSQTVARANFREIAPALYYDYVRRRVIGGNPNLAETHIQNGDLRIERFLGDSELLAASLFAKHFDRPIEKTVENAGDGDNVGFSNAESATSYGAELEARVSLGRLSSALAAFSVGGNLSLIGSQIELDGGASRSLQGQSPYVANLGLGYEHRVHRTRVDLAYNAFGRRIEEIGTGGAGNIYEEPFHRLDLTVSQPLPRNLRLKLAATNLLDQRVVRTQDDVEIFAYRVGVSVLGSVEYSLE